MLGLSAESALAGLQGHVFQRLRLTTALRELAHDRQHVRIVLRDATSLSGTIDRVGDDIVELAQHDPGEPRRRGDVAGVQVIPIAAIGAILSS